MSEFNPREPEQLYFARILPDAEDTASGETEKAAYGAFTSNEPSAGFMPVRAVKPGRDPAPVYDESQFTSNEPSGAFSVAAAEEAFIEEMAAFPQTDAPAAVQPGGRASRGALYAALKTEAGLNTDMLEPLPADANAFLPPAASAPTVEPSPAAGPDAVSRSADMDEAADGAADAVITAAAPPQAGEKGSLKSKAAAARAAVYADLKTEAGLNTDITEPLFPGRVRSLRTDWAAMPVPAAESAPAAAAPSPAVPAADIPPAAAPAPVTKTPPPAVPAADTPKAAVQEAPPASQDATRPYPPLHGDEPTKIAPPLKRSKPAAQPEASAASVPPATAAVPYYDVLMNENDLNPVNAPVNQPPVQEPVPADSMQEPIPERSLLAANLSAYYRRAASVSAQQNLTSLAEDPVQPIGEDSAAGNVYRPREASWAQEERRTMLADGEAQTYQVRTEEKRQPGRQRRKKRMIRRIVLFAVIAALLIGMVLLYLSHRPKEESVSPEQTPVVTATPKPIRGYDASAALPVSDTAGSAIAQISADVEMTPCAVTADNVLNRSRREDGLYDFYLFSADGQLLGYYDGLKQDGMHPMQSGGFYVDMPPYLVSTKGEAMVSLAGLETTLRQTFALRPFMNGWSRIVADDGESNFIDQAGNLLSRLWFCRSFSMTGTESVAYVDTGVLQSPSRYTLYLVNAADASTLKWKDAADDTLVVTAQLGMAYLQSGELFRIADLFADPEGLPLCITEQVRFYLDCNAMVVKDAASGKYALYVNGKQLYDAVYDSILPVESDVRWKGDILPGDRGQAMVLTISGASYPQPMSYYFTLTRDGVEEHVALSAVTNCPILPD